MTHRTPGPWQATTRGQEWIVRATDDTGRPVTSCWLNGDDSAANARLIAAAPETLEALERLIGAVVTEVNEKGGGGYILARLADARDAVIKAGGSLGEQAAQKQEPTK